MLATAPIGLLSMGYNKPNGSLQISDVNTRAESHWAAGGLVLIRWTPRNPWTTGEPTSNRVKASAGYADDAGVDLGDLITPDTLAKGRFDAFIDDVIDGLAALQQEGVVVLFCPLPEANSAHYWWGRRGRDRFMQVLEYVQSRMRAGGLTNLLWSTRPTRPRDLRAA